MQTVQLYDPFSSAGLDDLFRGLFKPVQVARDAAVAIKVDVTEKDNAYVVHDLYDTSSHLLNMLDACRDAGNENRPITFASTSKISLAGAGIAAMAQQVTVHAALVPRVQRVERCRAPCGIGEHQCFVGIPGKGGGNGVRRRGHGPPIVQQVRPAGGGAGRMRGFGRRGHGPALTLLHRGSGAKRSAPGNGSGTVRRA